MDFTVISDMSDGAHFKYWVRLSDGREGLYKINKTTATGDYTYENISEYLATAIGMILDIPMCDIILCENACISVSTATHPLQSFINYSEEFSHSYHMSNLSTFNVSSLLNPDNNKYVSEVIDMLLFDILIGNSDRHPGNFSLMGTKFYPLYDNGSSLCAYVNECDIDSILKDKMRWNALMYTKSKAVLRDDQKLQHYELLQLLRSMYPANVKDFRTQLSRLSIPTLISLISTKITTKRQTLLIRFLTERKEWFYE